VTTSSFDERAATWDDDPAKVERAVQVAHAIAETLPLDPSLRLLEYGAGTGLVTQTLRPSVGPVTLADTSAGMRQVIAEKVAAGVLTDASVWAVDLAEGPVPEERFDVVVTVMALHHIADLDAVLSAFASLLDPGGHLAVVDLDQEDGSFHSAGFEGHLGFDRADLGRRLEAHGFDQVTFRTCHEIVRADGTYPLFLATARRATGG
jgi:ubiquinone/menaquinone biosynthesis C-methylase UbiE